jgi:hypothetical protein
VYKFVAGGQERIVLFFFVKCAPDWTTLQIEFVSPNDIYMLHRVPISFYDRSFLKKADDVQFEFQEEECYIGPKRTKIKFGKNRQ